MRLFQLLTVLLLVSIASAAAQDGKPTYVITAMRSDTVMGQINIELFPDIAPKHVHNFDSLAAIGFFDGTAFHRVIPGFVIQGGDPNTKGDDKSTWGLGDESQTTVPAEFNVISHQRGIISAARSNDPNSATSQFFIVVAPATNLDRNYSVYGRVLSGMNIVDSIVRSPTEPNQFGENSRPVDKITMTIARTGVDTSIPGRVSLLSPNDDSTRIRAQQELRWARIDDAILYEVELSTSEDFSTITHHDSVATTTYTARSLQLDKTTYYWRVRASNGGRRGEWSSTRSFTTSISAPVPLSPANSDTNVALPATLVWRGVTGATAYRLQISSSLGFTAIVLDTVTTDTSYVTHGLAGLQRVYWRVYSLDGSGDSAQSARFNFRPAVPTGIASEILSDDMLSTAIRRDPTNRVMLAVELARATTLDIRIIDVAGRLVRHVARSEQFEAGAHDIDVDLDDVSGGTYFVVASTPAASVTHAVGISK